MIKFDWLIIFLDNESEVNELHSTEDNNATDDYYNDDNPPESYTESSNAKSVHKGKENWNQYYFIYHTNGYINDKGSPYDKFLSVQRRN